MTRLPSTALAVCLLLVAPTALAAQKVLIHGATRADVVREVNNQLSDQGFKLEDTTKSEARWGFDRGLVSQTSGGVAQSVPIVLELHMRFKDKQDGLEVTADEEVVGYRGRGSMEFRKPVRSTQERASMQQLLDIVKTSLEARRSP
jgi:hypothetical protein